MKLEYSIIIGSIIIALRILFGFQVTNQSESKYPELMNMKQTAEYLGIDEITLNDMIKAEQAMLERVNTNATTFPYVIINGEKYTTINQLQVWLEASTRYKYLYNTDANYMST